MTFKYLPRHRGHVSEASRGQDSTGGVLVRFVGAPVSPAALRDPRRARRPGAAIGLDPAGAARPSRQRVRVRGPRAGRRGLGRPGAGLRLRAVRQPEPHDAGGRRWRRSREGSSGLVTASGMGALSAFLLGGLRPGDHLVAGQDLYGATTALLREQAARWGIRVTFVDATEAAAVEAAVTEATRAIFVEAISNPLLRVADLPGLADARAPAGAHPPGGQHLRVAGASPAARARRHRGAPQRHQVPLRPRRRHGRESWSGPGPRRRGAGPGDTGRPEPRPLRRVAHAARRADAGAPHGAALRERARAGAVPRRPAAKWRGCTIRGCRTIRSTPSRGRSFRAASVACCPWSSRAAPTRSTGSSARWPAVGLARAGAADRLRPELRGRDDDVDLSGAHLAPAAVGGGAGEARHRSGAGASVRRDRGRGGPQGVVRRGAAGGLP